MEARQPRLLPAAAGVLPDHPPRAVVLITTADDGGYFVDVKVLKEPGRPARAVPPPPARPTYRLVPTVERQFEVVTGEVFDAAWIPVGRDHKLEQCILDRLARMDISTPCARPEGSPPGMTFSV
ncbi:MAG: hypothetical protein U0797_10850 [Gemmataceae bacterium]